MGDTRNYAALDWVVGEIGETLNEARQALEAYVADPKDNTRIRFCLNYIHQVHGSLKLVEFRGAALFAEEMELLADALRMRKVSNEKEAQEVLMRSLLQLPIYLDQVKAYREDHPGIVLPLLNDVRAARKQPYLSETSLFNPNMAAAKHIRGQRHDILSDTAKLKPVIKKLREMYQYAAASVLRGIKIDENLAYLEKVFIKLEGIARGTASHALWFVSAALMEALLRDDVELSVAVRGLLRHLARELQLIENECPGAFDNAPRESLLRNLLYYVACAEAGGKRVDMVKKIYALENALLGGTLARAALRQGLISAPDDNAIKAVAIALQDELNTVKHLIDLVLSGQGSESDMREMLPVVKRIGDTLAVMGIPDMRDQVLSHHDALKAFADKGSWTEEEIITIAGKIADVENRLHAIAKGSSGNRNIAQLDEREVEIDSAKAAVLDECRSGLNQIRETIIAGTSSGWQVDVMGSVVDIFHNIQGGLNIVPLPRSAAVISACNRYVEQRLLHSRDEPAEQLVLLAEAIECVDYYLESVAAGHTDNIERYLDMAIENLDKLDSPVDSQYAAAPVVEESVADGHKAEDVSQDVDANIAEEHLETTPEASIPEEAVDEPAVESETSLEEPTELDDEPLESDTVFSVQEDGSVEEVDAPESQDEEPESSLELSEEENDIDEEILEIFVEEAAEVQETLAEYFPKWAENMSDEESLTVTRRSFHTLKGSGRMVKAMDVGELAWSVENMLNRVIDQTITPDDNHIRFIKMVLALVPTLVSAFEAKKPNPEKSLTEQYIEWGNQLSKGEIPADFPTAEGAVAAPVVEAEDETDEEEDRVLWEIFASEAKTHLEEVDQFIKDMDYAAPIYETPSDNLQRALHTLKGSAHMAGVTPIASLMAPLERFVKELRSYQVKIDEDILQLMRDAASYTHHGVDAIEKEQEPEVPKLDQFLARVAELNEKHITPLIHLREASQDGHAQVDPRLLSIFMAEDMRLLLDADEVIEPWLNAQHANEQSIDSLISELSTLSEGAEQANLPLMSALSAQLKQVFEKVQSGALAQDESLHDVIKPAHDYLLDMVDAVAAGQTMLPVSDKLQSQLDELVAIEEATEEVPEEQTSTEESVDEAVDDVVADTVEDAPSDSETADVIEFPVNLTVDEPADEELSIDETIAASDITDEVDEEAPSLAPEEDDMTLEVLPEDTESQSVVDEPEAFEFEEQNDAALEDASSETVEDNIPDFILDKHAPSASAPEEDTVEESSAFNTDIGGDHIAYVSADDFDRDILEIFLDEAGELIEELDEALHDWESDWNNEEAKDTMLRALHTVKGGARLSGIKNVGELVHNYETYLIATKPESDEAFFKNIHAYQDRFHFGIKSVKALINGEPLPEEKTETADTLPDNVEISEEEREAAIGFATGEQPKPPVVETESADADDTAYEKVDPKQAQNPVIPLAKKAGESGDGFVVPKSSAQAPVQQPVKRQGSQEMVKVSAELLEELVNLAGETSISRGRLEQQITDLNSAVEDVDGTLSRLQEQLRRLDQETEAQVLFKQEQMAHHEEFDPLEMDRYSHLQQLSRSLMESASDLQDLKSTLKDKIRDTETLLLQQSRINSSLQEGLMRTRMVPFSRLVPRLRRIVRQVAAELGKHVNFELDNVEGEMDRSVLERMVAPLEHMLRNAVDHGIESPSDRLSGGKSETGRILLSLSREGGDILLRLADDGRGIDLSRVREKAIESGLMAADSDLSDHEVMQFILQAGFSTAENVTQISGRGVGMDVVAAEIKQLGGTIVIDSKQGTGTQFTVRLPFTVSVNRALMVQLGSDTFAIPLNTIEGIVRVSPFELEHYYNHPEARFEYAGENYQVRHVGNMLSPDIRPRLEGQLLPLPVILVRTAQHTMALQVDALMGSREIVVKTLGPQFSAVQGISGATVMGDGSVVIIVDPHALVRREVARASLGQQTQTLIEKPGEQYESTDGLKTVMVVDDSVTVRKVTTRFLEREGYHVITAKDGVEALQTLQEETPDLMLLDIEMPRMDGFEVARNVRGTSTLKHLPIIMITSRTGSKHKQHALSLGVNDYMGKPYQEDVLLKAIKGLLSKRPETT